MRELISICNSCARILQLHLTKSTRTISSCLVGYKPLNTKEVDYSHGSRKTKLCRRFSRDSSQEETFSSYSEEETEKFTDLTPGWWDINGEMMALHSMNQVRVPFIRDCILYQGYSDGRPFTAEPLKGVEILDVGCGGGILTEPLARLGANVVGIDSSEAAIEVAKQHRPPQLTNLQYLNALVEDIASVGSLKFDAVIASEVIEHIRNQSVFVETCSSVLKPGGSLIISTVNRTLLSYALVIAAAEKVFRVVPDGAHNWSEFITVEELTNYMSAAKCHLRKIHGMLYNPICNSWSFIGNTDMNYIVHSVKEDESVKGTQESEYTE